MANPQDRLAVIIATLGRPDSVDRCLECLDGQTRAVDQILVVDGSTDDLTRHVVANHAGVIYVRNANGFGRMTGSRNLGLLKAEADIIAYIDDDAFAHPQWAENLLAAYDDPKIGAVGGRALNNRAGEETAGVAEVGKMLRNGDLTGYFAADTGSIVEVDHVIGCNMSFRASVLGELGGFHEFYPGYCCTYEEADLCMRIRRLGYRIVYTPHAVVDHVAAPRKVGKRFDPRYVFGVTRNHCTLLARNLGPQSFVTWVLPVRLVWNMTIALARKLARELRDVGLKFIAVWGGALIGLVGGLIQRARQRTDLVRRDETGVKIHKHLSAWTSRSEPDQEQDIQREVVETSASS